MKTFHRQRHHPLTVTYENTDLVHLVLVATKPADAGKTSRPVRAGDLCRKCVVSRHTLRSMMGQESCLVYHCCRHTMVSKLKLDHNEVPRAFVPSIEGAFCQSLFEHTPSCVDLKFTLCSLTQVTIHFVLRLTFYQAHDFFKMSCLQKKVQSLIRQRFFCFVIFLEHEILQNPIVWGRK